MINFNMRCIEILKAEFNENFNALINFNMRCIEIVFATKNRAPIRDKL